MSAAVASSAKPVLRARLAPGAVAGPAAQSADAGPAPGPVQAPCGRVGRAPLRFKNLGVLLTLRCPARCAHCGTQSSPERREGIAPELAARAVEEAARLGLPVVLSGGEPVLRFPLVLDLARRASRLGVGVAVYTSGYWARSPAQADAVVKRLGEAGVNTLLLSTDVHHLSFVPARAVEFAARAALAAGMHCEIAVPSPNDAAPESAELAARFRRLPGALIKTHPLSDAGRAAALPPEAFSRRIYDHPCATVGQLALTPDGFLYVCCGAAMHFGHDSVLCAGNLAESSLADALARWAAIPLVGDLQRFGPLRAGGLEGQRNARFSLELKSAYSDLCAECREVCRAFGRARPSEIA